MGLKEIYNSMNGSTVKSDGTATEDKVLLSLRRQKRLMDEKEEKERLKVQLRKRALENDRSILRGQTIAGGRNILSKDSKPKEKQFMTAKSNIFS